jgi:hypothetical protein
VPHGEVVTTRVRVHKNLGVYGRLGPPGPTWAHLGSLGQLGRAWTQPGQSLGPDIRIKTLHKPRIQVKTGNKLCLNPYCKNPMCIRQRAQGQQLGPGQSRAAQTKAQVGQLQGWAEGDLSLISSPRPAWALAKSGPPGPSPGSQGGAMAVLATLGPVGSPGPALGPPWAQWAGRPMAKVLNTTLL